MLGDSGYGVKNYLLTPLLNPRTEGERKYNNTFKSARQSVIECLFGKWKRRFPILSNGKLKLKKIKVHQFNRNLLEMQTDVNFSVIVIIATAVLHNYSLINNVPLPQIILNSSTNRHPPIDEFNDDAIENRRNADNRTRNAIIARYFENSSDSSSD